MTKWSPTYSQWTRTGTFTWGPKTRSWESFWESNTLKRSTRLLRNAEESSYMYQKQTWLPLVRLLDNNDLKRQGKEGLGLGSLLVRAKMEAFMKGFDEISQRHRGSYRFPDLDLRVQIEESTMKLVVPVYTEFSNTYSAMLRGKLYLVQRKYKGCWVRFSTVRMWHCRGGIPKVGLVRGIRCLLREISRIFYGPDQMLAMCKSLLSLD